MKVNLYEYLRCHTLEHHERVAHDPWMQKLLYEEIGLDDYKRILRKLLKSYVRIESAIDAIALGAEVQHDYSPRRQLLQSDLSHLGEAGKAACGNAGHPPAGAIAGGRFAYMGMRYVLEGKSNGDKVINSSLQANTAIPLQARTFWAMQDRFKQEFAALRTMLAREYSEQECSQALRSATWAYEVFIHEMQFGEGNHE